MVKKRKCRPQNYQCGGVCIKGAYICHVDGLTGQSLSIANNFESLIRMTKGIKKSIKDIDNKIEELEKRQKKYDKKDILDRTTSWLEERNFDTEKDLMVHESLHTVAKDILGVTSEELAQDANLKTIGSDFGEPSDKGPDVLEEMIVAYLEGVVGSTAFGDGTINREPEDPESLLSRQEIFFDVDWGNNRENIKNKLGEFMESISKSPDLDDYVRVIMEINKESGDPLNLE